MCRFFCCFGDPDLFVPRDELCKMAPSFAGERAIPQGARRSVWDVINASMTGLVPLIGQLSLYEHVGTDRILDPTEVDHRISDDIEKDVAGWLTIASRFAQAFQCPISEHRITYFRKVLAKGLTWRTLGDQAKVLREAIEADLQGQLIYRYQDDRAKIFLTWKADWDPIIQRFPSAAPDVLACVDCYALGYGTASVFHAMRILEYGLAALARDLGIEPGVENWQVIINRIEAEIRHQGQSLPRGTEKTERLEFLSSAAKEFMYFKDGWRNHVSHNRATYDEHQARSAMEHVRNFMKILSSRLSETPLPC